GERGGEDRRRRAVAGEGAGGDDRRVGSLPHLLGDLLGGLAEGERAGLGEEVRKEQRVHVDRLVAAAAGVDERVGGGGDGDEVGRDQPGALVDQLVEGVLRSEEHTSELQSRENLVCRLLLEKKKHQLTT